MVRFAGEWGGDTGQLEHFAVGVVGCRLSCGFIQSGPCTCTMRFEGGERSRNTSLAIASQCTEPSLPRPCPNPAIANLVLRPLLHQTRRPRWSPSAGAALQTCGNSALFTFMTPAGSKFRCAPVAQQSQSFRQTRQMRQWFSLTKSCSVLPPGFHEKVRVDGGSAGSTSWRLSVRIANCAVQFGTGRREL